VSNGPLTTFQKPNTFFSAISYFSVLWFRWITFKKHIKFNMVYIEKSDCDDTDATGKNHIQGIT
jgi:hypothetical protein